MTVTRVEKGQTFTLESLAFKRPGTHISVERYEEIIGKKAARDLEAGVFLEKGDFE